jgi:hypothetical protein
MLRILSLVPFFLFLAACAGTDKDVTKCGKGIYVAEGSPDHPFGNYMKTAQNVALERANTYCQSKRKQVLVVDMDKGLPVHLTFRCLDEDDPQLKQSDFANAPALTNRTPCD